MYVSTTDVKKLTNEKMTWKARRPTSDDAKHRTRTAAKRRQTVEEDTENVRNKSSEKLKRDKWSINELWMDG